MPASTVKIYPCGYFAPYIEPFFGQAVADQLAFLQQHAPVSAERAPTTPTG